MKSRLLEKATFITLYSVSSIATFDLNKYIMQEMKFEMHFLLVVLQCIIIVTIIRVQTLVSNVTLRFSQHKKWHLTSILLTAMMLTGMKATLYFPATLYTLYKNLAIILTAFAEFYFFGRRVTLIAVISFCVMIYSSIFGNDIDTVKRVGYIWMALNILSTTGYVLYLKKLMALDRYTRTESVFFTNLISVPFVIILSIAFDKVSLPPITFKLAAFIFLSSLTAYLTSYSTAWSMSILSSTSYSMIGAVNKLALSASGFAFFKENFETKKLISLFIGILASLIYSLDSAKNVPISQIPPAEPLEG